MRRFRIATCTVASFAADNGESSLLFQVHDAAEQGIAGLDGLKIRFKASLRDNLLYGLLTEVDIRKLNRDLIAAWIS